MPPRIQAADNQLTKKQYTYVIQSAFKFSHHFQYQYAITQPGQLDTLVFEDRRTGQHVAVAPILTPDQIGSLHKNLLARINNPLIEKFFYSSNTSQEDNDHLDHNAIHFIQANRVKNTLKVHYDTRSTVACIFRTDETAPFDTFYFDLIVASQNDLQRPIGVRPITETVFTAYTNTDLGLQIMTPLTAITGRHFLEASDKEVAAFIQTQTGEFITPENLHLLRTMNANNQQPFSIDSVFNLSPEKTYFYLAGLLSSPLSGFEHNNLGISIVPQADADSDFREECQIFEAKGILAYPHWGAAAETIPEIGRVFYDPVTGKKIALLVPGHEELDGTEKGRAIKASIKRQCDTVLQVDAKSNFANTLLADLKILGFAVTQVDDLISVMFEEPLADARPLMQISALATQPPAAALDSYNTPPTTRREMPAASPATPQSSVAAAAAFETPARQLTTAVFPRSAAASSASAVASSSPRKCTTRDPEKLEEAQQFMFRLNERLTGDDYYAALHGVLLNIYKTTMIDRGDDQTEISRTLKKTSQNLRTTAVNLPSIVITIHKPCGLEAAKASLATASGEQVYLIQEDNKPLLILYFDGKDTRLFYPELGIKNKPWEDLNGDISINHKPVTKITVDCADCSQEHQVFHALCEQLVNDGTLTNNLNNFKTMGTTPNVKIAAECKTLDAIKAAINFSAIQTTPPTETITSQDQPSAYSIVINPLPNSKEESAMVAAYCKLVTDCYEMGMMLISRIQDEQYHDLGFMFRHPGSGEYVLIKHPTHPTTITDKALKRIVKKELERLNLPAKDIKAISFRDEPPKYAMPKPLSAAEQQILLNAQIDNVKNPIQTLYDLDDTHPETRASLVFKRRFVLEYLANAYRPVANVKTTDDQHTLAVMFRDHRENKFYTIAHPHHAQTVSKRDIERAVQAACLNIVLHKNTTFEPIQYFKDDRDLPRHSVTVKQLGTFTGEASTQPRTELSDEKAVTAAVNTVMRQVGFEVCQRDQHDPRPPYHFTTPQPLPVAGKSVWQKIKEHFAKHKGKWLIGLGLVGGAVIAGVTFGFGLIPTMIGAMALAAPAALAATGASIAVSDYRDAAALNKHIEEKKQQCSSWLIASILDSNRPTSVPVTSNEPTAQLVIPPPKHFSEEDARAECLPASTERSYVSPAAANLATIEVTPGQPTNPKASARRALDLGTTPLNDAPSTIEGRTYTF